MPLTSTKIFFSLLLFQLGMSLSAQWVDSSSVSYHNDTLSIYIEGDVFIYDHDAIEKISDTLIGDTIFVDVIFFPCSPLQMYAPYDTSIIISKALKPGLKHLRLYTYIYKDTLGTCHGYSNTVMVDTVKFTFNVPLTDKEVTFQQIEVYPNPANDLLFLKSSTHIEWVEIVNSVGLVVKKINQPKSLIDISELQNGVYFLKVESKEELTVKRFIKL